MTKTTTLLMMATALAPMPLHAAQAPTAAQRFEMLAAPVPPCGADMHQRATLFAPAALLPSDVDMALVVPRIKEQLNVYYPTGILLAPPIGSIALGLAQGSGKSLDALRTFKALMMLPGATGDAAVEWRKDARDSLGDLITQAASRLGQESRSQAGSELSQVVIHPIYLIAAPEKGEEGTLKTLMNLYTHTLHRQAARLPGVDAVELGGLKGVKISGNALSGLMAAEDADQDAPPTEERLYLQAELSKRSFYLLAGMRGENAVVVLCEYPEEIRWAAHAGQSVLATGAWKAAEACPADGKIALIATMAPSLYASMPCAPSVSVLTRLSWLFTTMAGQEHTDAAVFRAAAAGLDSLASDVQALQPDITKAAALQVWETPGHIHLALHSDARGMAYQPGQLRLGTVADTPDNVLYLESTKGDWAHKPNVAQLLQAATAALEGGLATLHPTKRSRAGHAMRQLKRYLPEMQEAVQALGTLRAALCNTDALVVDATDQVLPFMGGKKEYLPCFSYYAGVGERAKLTAGWERLTSAAAKALTKSGISPMLPGALPVRTSTVGKTASYSLALPFSTPETGANVTVGDTDFAIGTSARLNAQLVGSATGHLDFAGAAFSVNVVQLAKVSRTIAEIAGREEDLIGEDFVDEADDVADMLETAAALFGRVWGTSTVKDGMHTLHLDLQKRQRPQSCR